jgi:UDP-N-acetylglucosamine acyltransferase
MAYAHVAHDCVVGDDNVFANNAGIACHVNVGNNVTIGALTTIHQFCQIGDYSFAGMNTSITMDVPAYIKVASNPARVIGLNSVGMGRAGINQETITILKKVYKIIYRKGFNLKDAIAKVESMDCFNVEEVQNFISSLKSSERGILR